MTFAATTVKFCCVYALIIAASSWSYNETRLAKISEICDNVRRIGGQIDSAVFRKMTTGDQTILMLTEMPETVGVREVDQLSYVYLAHLQDMVLYEATVCEKSPAVGCQRIWALLDELTLDASNLLPVQHFNDIDHPARAIFSLQTLNNVVEPFVRETKTKLQEILFRCEDMLLL